MLKQNICFWKTQQPHQHLESNASTEKVIVWCAIGKNRIIGPYLFKDDNGNAVRVNSDFYITLIQTKFIPSLRRKRGINMKTAIFQEDGAPSHWCCTF